LETEPRKASEVLLDVEKKLDVALGIIHVQDLNIKILSNKLNSILELLEKQTSTPQKITVEAVNVSRAPLPGVYVEPEKQIPISAEFALPIENSPQGFRRTSRPETFSGDNSYLPDAANSVSTKFPTQILKPPPGRSATNAPTVGREVNAEVVSPPTVRQLPKTQDIIQNAIPVTQRVVNKEGKSLFLADVEIIDLSSMQPVFKTRTNGTGKWSASLGVGDYRIVINKRESSTGGRLEATQDIHIDGSESKVDLQTIIIKA
jgi:hypothetical protein